MHVICVHFAARSRPLARSDRGVLLPKRPLDASPYPRPHQYLDHAPGCVSGRHVENTVHGCQPGKRNSVWADAGGRTCGIAEQIGAGNQHVDLMSRRGCNRQRSQRHRQSYVAIAAMGGFGYSLAADCLALGCWCFGCRPERWLYTRLACSAFVQGTRHLGGHQRG